MVFESIEDFKSRIDDLDVPVNSVLVLQGCGPRGYPGMPEVGNMRLPRRLLEQGVADMVRISDARMSGTAFGTAVLHVAPGSAAGGPLAFVKDGDPIVMDVADRRLTLDIPADEYERRRAAWSPPAPEYDRGYYRLYLDRVLRAATPVRCWTSRPRHSNPKVPATGSQCDSPKTSVSSAKPWVLVKRK